MCELHTRNFSGSETKESFYRIHMECLQQLFSHYLMTQNLPTTLILTDRDPTADTL